MTRISRSEVLALASRAGELWAPHRIYCTRQRRCEELREERDISLLGQTFTVLIPSCYRYESKSAAIVVFIELMFGIKLVDLNHTGSPWPKRILANDYAWIAHPAFTCGWHRYYCLRDIIPYLPIKSERERYSCVECQKQFTKKFIEGQKKKYDTRLVQLNVRRHMSYKAWMMASHLYYYPDSLICSYECLTAFNWKKEVQRRRDQMLEINQRRNQKWLRNGKRTLKEIRRTIRQMGDRPV